MISKLLSPQFLVALGCGTMALAMFATLSSPPLISRELTFTMLGLGAVTLGLVAGLPRGRKFPQDSVIEFITDVEGNWDYFQALVASSSILSMTSNGQLKLAGENSFMH
jgi:hypothetical protein